MEYAREGQANNMARDEAKPMVGAGALGYASGIAQQTTDPWKHRSAGMQCRTCMWFADARPVRDVLLARRWPLPSARPDGQGRELDATGRQL